MKKILFSFLIAPYLLFAQNDFVGHNYMNISVGRSFTSIKNHKVIERSPSQIFTPYEDAADGINLFQVSLEHIGERSYAYSDPFLSTALYILTVLPYSLAVNKDLPEESKEVVTGHLDLLRFGFGGWRNNNLGFYFGGQMNYTTMDANEKFMEKYREEQKDLTSPNNRFVSVPVSGFFAGLGTHTFYQFEKFLFQHSFMYGRRLNNRNSLISGRNIQNVISVKYGNPDIGLMSTFRYSHSKINFDKKPNSNTTYANYDFDKISGNNVEFYIGFYFGI